MFAFKKKKMRNKKEDFKQSAVPQPLLLQGLQLLHLQGLQQHLQELQPILHPRGHQP
jgi:hypothetical protein